MSSRGRSPSHVHTHQIYTNFGTNLFLSSSTFPSHPSLSHPYPHSQSRYSYLTSYPSSTPSLSSFSSSTLLPSSPPPISSYFPPFYSSTSTFVLPSSSSYASPVSITSSSASTESTQSTPQTDCGGEIYLVSNDLEKIESPNYPSTYPPNLHCSWFIHGTQGSTIKGTFINFHLHSPSSSVTVYDVLGGDDLALVLSATGSALPPLFSSSNSIQIVFITGSVPQQSGGFSLVLELIETDPENSTDIRSLQVETWIIVLINAMIVLLIILTIVFFIFHRRPPCRGSNVADYHAWQLRSARPSANGPALPTVSACSGNEKSDIEQALGIATRGRPYDIDGSPLLPTRRIFRHIDWKIGNSPNHSYNIARALDPSNDDDDVDDMVMETVFDKRDAYHPDFHLDVNEDADDVENGIIDGVSETRDDDDTESDDRDDVTDHDVYHVNEDDVDVANGDDVDGNAGIDDDEDDDTSIGLDEFMIDMLRKKDRGNEIGCTITEPQDDVPK
ncbi:uncharacterized protein LOC121430873 [Lytechinus variegatus]|uniref:uncharacterized protein LOC121430873 n=1 Tax=Lytechinus variegatus TaxID=7654 RepID=UPI001BB2228F|nr:uncharacterized protein LOC121430873 [Lytechinus variegatus]